MKRAGLWKKCFFAYAAAEFLKTLPIHEELLERDLASSDEVFSLKEPMVIDCEVKSGSPFDGTEVRDLGLPAGCMLVRILDGGREQVPTAATRLEAYMKVTAVIAPQATNGLAALRNGCKAKKR